MLIDVNDIVKNIFLNILIYFNFMIFYANLCEYHRQTDKHIKIIVRKLTKVKIQKLYL